MTAHSTTPSDERGGLGDTLDLSAFFRLVGEVEAAPPDQAGASEVLSTRAGRRPFPYVRLVEYP